MQIIASNITTRTSDVASIFRHRVSACENAGADALRSIGDLALDCVKAGANVLEINLQQHFDRPEEMEFAVNAVQGATDCQLCLSSNKPEALEVGLKLCRRPPIVNYVGLEINRLQEILPLAARYQADVILLASDPAAPGDARQMMEKSAVLVGAANNAGIPNERILLDPGIFHVTQEQGQRHLAEILEWLPAVPETFEPAVRTTCWPGNSSAGAPARLRTVIETALLPLLSGVGLSSVFLNVLKQENMRTVRLLKIFRNEEIYAEGGLSPVSR